MRRLIFIFTLMSANPLSIAESAPVEIRGIVLNADEALSIESDNSNVCRVAPPETVVQAVEDFLGLKAFSLSQLEVKLLARSGSKQKHVIVEPNPSAGLRTDSDNNIEFGYSLEWSASWTWKSGEQINGVIGRLEGVLYKESIPRYFSLPAVVEITSPEWNSIETNDLGYAPFTGRILWGAIQWHDSRVKLSLEENSSTGTSLGTESDQTCRKDTEGPTSK